MGSVRRFAAVNTKIRAIEGQLLQDHDYEHLLSCKTVEDMIHYLRQETGYRRLLNQVKGASIELDALESLFKKELYRELQSFVHYFTDQYRKLFRILFMRYEVEDIKVMLRAIIRQEHLADLEAHMIILGVSKNLDYERLFQSRTLEDFIDNLEGTPYQKTLAYYMDEDPTKRLFYMEMNLDRLYFKHLSDQAKKLDPRDGAPLIEVLGKNTDILNLQWIYRGLKSYRLSPEELLNYTLNHGYYLKYKHLKNLCYSQSMDELSEKIKQTKYAFLLQGERVDRFMEIRMERYVYAAFQKKRKEEPMSIAEVLVFMHRLEYEIRDLFTLFEAKRYNLDKEGGRRYLVRMGKGGSPHGS